MKTIRQIHDLYNSKKLSPVELTQEFLKKIHSSPHNAYLSICDERALNQAKRATEILAREGRVPTRSPAFGIPLAIKDVFTLDGVRTTCASKMLENYHPPYTATCVRRLEDAGAITLGKTNMDEFAMGGSNENSAFGKVQHPTHPGRVPGGSSGGSGTAVSADLCVAALGTDTGGSIRLPASFCGIVGMKPTYGRISRYGLIAFASSLDQCGPMTHSVEDAAILYDIMAGADPMDSTTSTQAKGNAPEALKKNFDWSGLKIGVPHEYFGEGMSPAVEKSVRSAIAWMEKQGAQTVPISLPHTRYSVATYYVVAVSEASSNLARFDGVRFGSRPQESVDAKTLADFYKKNRSLFGPEVKRRIILGTFALSAGYYDAYYNRACQVRRLIQQDFLKAFQNVDLIAAPVAPTTAFEEGSKSRDPLQMYLMDIDTIPASLAGLPALSVPCGMDDHKLPIGLHLIAPHFQEERLFCAAHAFEKGRA